METNRLALPWSLVALAACTNEPVIAAGSFDVVVTVSFPAGTDVERLPRAERLTLRLDEAPDGSVVAVWGTGASTSTTTLERAGSVLALRESVWADIPDGPDRPPGDVLHLDSADLTLIDADRDGEPEAVRGIGDCEYTYYLLSSGQRLSCTFTLEGTPDVTPPEFTIEGDPARLHVLERLRVLASEPLDPATKILLWHGTSLIPVVSIPAGEPYVWEFRSGEILPFGAELRIQFDPPPRDLAGLEAASVPTTVQTLPDPGMFAEDGFEGGVVGILEGAEIVTGVGSLPAIAGARSLLVESPRDRALFRIPVTGGETIVRFRARVLVANPEYAFCSSIGTRVGVQRPAPYPPYILFRPLRAVEQLEVVLDHPSWVASGPELEREFPVNVDGAGEVIVEFTADPWSSFGPQCPPMAVLVDELRLE